MVRATGQYALVPLNEITLFTLSIFGLRNQHDCVPQIEKPAVPQNQI